MQHFSRINHLDASKTHSYFESASMGVLLECFPTRIAITRFQAANIALFIFPDLEGK